MPEDVQVQVEAQPSIASLVGGIINDAQQLIRQEVTLAKQEIKEELAKTKAVAAAFASAAVLGVLSALMLCLTLVHFLHWAANEHVRSENLPLWGCYGIVGALFLAVAGVLYYIGKSQANRIDLVPRQTVETIRENVQWIKNQT